MSTEKKQKRTYMEAFKRDALSLVTEQGYSVAEAARSLGINDNLIYKWHKNFSVQEDEMVLRYAHLSSEHLRSAANCINDTRRYTIGESPLSVCGDLERIMALQKGFTGR